MPRPEEGLRPYPASRHYLAGDIYQVQVMLCTSSSIRSSQVYPSRPGLSPAGEAQASEPQAIHSLASWSRKERR
jgi:hypothetical protein